MTEGPPFVHQCSNCRRFWADDRPISFPEYHHCRRKLHGPTAGEVLRAQAEERQQKETDR